MDSLKSCPCGTIPSNLVVDPIVGSKWATVTGSCCGEWEIEFRTNYERDLKGLLPLAVAAWNSAPRSVDDALREELRLANAARENENKRADQLADLVRFIAGAWDGADELLYAHCSGEVLATYPVVQGTSLQIKLKRIGQQSYDKHSLCPAIDLMLGEGQHDD